MRTWALVALVLAVAPARAQTEGAGDDSAARFDRMSEQEKAQLRERLRQFKALPLDEQARMQANVARWRALPPEEKARVRQNLEAFQRLSPDERQRLLAQWREFQKLTAGSATGAAPADARVPPGQSGAAPADDGEPPRLEGDDARAARADAAAAPRDAGEAGQVTGLLAVLVLLSTDAGSFGTPDGGVRSPPPASRSAEDEEVIENLDLLEHLAESQELEMMLELEAKQGSRTADHRRPPGPPMVRTSPGRAAPPRALGRKGPRPPDPRKRVAMARMPGGRRHEDAGGRLHLVPDRRGRQASPPPPEHSEQHAPLATHRHLRRGRVAPGRPPDPSANRRTPTSPGGSVYPSGRRPRSAGEGRPGKGVMRPRLAPSRRARHRLRRGMARCYRVRGRDASAARAQDVAIPPSVLLPNYDRVQPGTDRGPGGGGVHRASKECPGGGLQPRRDLALRPNEPQRKHAGLLAHGAGGHGFEHASPVSNFASMPSFLGWSSAATFSAGRRCASGSRW